MGPAAVLLALLCMAPALTAIAQEQRLSSSDSMHGCSLAEPAEQQQCPVAPWYSIHSGSCAAAAQEATSPATVQQQQASATQAQQDSSSACTDRQVYIVRFSQYRMLSELKELLVEVSA
jgi:hypothetical protein